MAVKSKILLSEGIKNKDELHYPVYIDNGEGVEPALFTKNQIKVAIKRAKRNPEDIGQQYVETPKGFFARLFG